MLTVQAFLEGFLVTWETEKHSVDPDDSGNYFKGKLVGSKYGVTGAVLAKYRKVATVTKADVASVTLVEAAAIARQTYYDEAQFDLLPWGPVVASAVDKCYMSGEDAAVKCIQRAAGALDDGHIGPKTIELVAKAARNPVLFAADMAKERAAHEALVIKAHPEKAKYRNGWNNRSNSYIANTPWWASWHLPANNLMPGIVGNGELVPVPQSILDETQDALKVITSKPQEVAMDISETAQANIKELAKELPRNQVIDILAKEPAGVLEHVKETAKLKLSEKSTWVGAAITVGSVLADPSVQAAIKPTIAAIKSGSFGGILAALIGVAMIVFKPKSSPRADAVIAAKRLSEPG